MGPIKLKVKGKRQKMLFFCDKGQKSRNDADSPRQQMAFPAAVLPALQMAIFLLAEEQ